VRRWRRYFRPAWWRATGRELIEWCADLWRAAHEYDAYAWMSPSRPTRLRFACSLVADFGPRLLCAFVDHDLIDDGSYATPDGGQECLRCRRCGWSWSHTY
jgi:hypothetical protein